MWNKIQVRFIKKFDFLLFLSYLMRKEDEKMLADQITDFIRSQYSGGNGRTQDAIGKSLNISQSFVNRIISGKLSPENMKIGTLQKMFPNATINLTGAPVTVGNHNSGAVAGLHAGDNFFAPPASATVPPEVSAVLASPLPAEEKAAILRALYHSPASEVKK